MEISKNHLLNFFLFSSIVLIYTIPSLINGYPLFLSDSGTYLISGQTGDVPVDRPIIYGLFVRHLSLSWSIWLVLIIQNIILHFCLWAVVKYVLRTKKTFLIHFLLGLFLFMFTGVSYHSNLIIADIFTSISILTTILLFVIPTRQYFHYIFTIIIFTFSLITHLSHIPLVLGLIGIIFLVNFFKSKRAFFYKRILIAVGMVGISLFSLATVNYSYGAGFKLSRIKYIVIAARFIDSGIANRFLKDECTQGGQEKSYNNLCNYIDRFQEWPNTGSYLWSDNSPIYDGPCIEKTWSNCWIEKEKNYEDLVNDILSVEEYRNEFIAQIVAGTFRQLVNFEQSMLDKTDMKWVIDNFYEADSFSLLNSTQYKENIFFDKASLIEALTFDFSIVLILLLLFRYRNHVSRDLKLVLLCVGVSLLLNALICSSLSNFVPRYQGRIIFLGPMCLFLLTFELFKYRIHNKKLNLNDYL